MVLFTRGLCNYTEHASNRVLSRHLSSSIAGSWPAGTATNQRLVGALQHAPSRTSTHILALPAAHRALSGEALPSVRTPDEGRRLRAPWPTSVQAQARHARLWAHALWVGCSHRRRAVRAGSPWHAPRAETAFRSACDRKSRGGAAEGLLLGLSLVVPAAARHVV